MTAGRLCLLLLLTCAPLAARADDDAPRLRYGPAKVVATLADQEINESSGLVAGGPQNPGIFFTHNDSGDVARFFAIDATGADRGQWRLKGVDAQDCEEMAAYTDAEGARWLVLADTGDNDRKREHVTLYFVPEPKVGETPVKAELEVSRRLTLRYQDGAHDVESVAVAPQEGAIYLVTKDRGDGTHVLRCPLAPEGDQATPQPVAQLDLPMTTAMDMSPDERRVVILTYTNAWEWARGGDETWDEAFKRAPREVQVNALLIQREAICYGQDGQTLYLTSEKLPTPLVEIPVLKDEEPAETSSPEASPPQRSEH